MVSARPKTTLVRRAFLLGLVQLACGENDMKVEVSGPLSTEELARRAIQSEGWPLGGVGTSNPVPFSAGPSPLAVMFNYGYSRPKPKEAPQDWRPTLTSPGELRYFDPMTGALVRSSSYEGAPWTVPADKPGSAEEQAERQKRWAALQDQLAPAFYAGEPRVPDNLTAIADEYRSVFQQHVQSLLRAYREVAPAWCAWVGL